MNQYQAAYNSQKRNAQRRGIEFRLSFEQWLAFWGDDIDRLGSGECDLQMQRVADRGAYELGNIKKGTPKQNAATERIMRKSRASIAAAKELQEALDRAMFEESSADEDEFSEDDCELAHLGFSSSYDRRHTYVG